MGTPLKFVGANYGSTGLLCLCYARDTRAGTFIYHEPGRNQGFLRNLLRSNTTEYAGLWD